MIEKDVETYLKKKVDAIGGLCWKFVSPGTDGVPDRLVIVGGLTFFIELKRPGEKLRELQIVRAKQLKERGMYVLTIDSKLAVDAFMNTLKGMLDYEIQAP